MHAQWKKFGLVLRPTVNPIESLLYTVADCSSGVFATINHEDSLPSYRFGPDGHIGDVTPYQFRRICRFVKLIGRRCETCRKARIVYKLYFSVLQHDFVVFGEIIYNYLFLF